MLRSTWVSAAMFTTASTWLIILFSCWGLQMSPLMNVYRLLFSMSCKFAGLAPKPILSMLINSQSGCFVSICLQKLLPMKPKPPVTRSFMGVSLVWWVVPVPWFSDSGVVFFAVYRFGYECRVVPGSAFFVWVIVVV